MMIDNNKTDVPVTEISKRDAERLRQIVEAARFQNLPSFMFIYPNGDNKTTFHIEELTFGQGLSMLFDSMHQLVGLELVRNPKAKTVPAYQDALVGFLKDIGSGITRANDKIKKITKN